MELDFGATRFDVVILSETIEHLADADAAAERIRHLVRPRGLLCVSTPNAVRIENRLRKLLGMKPSLVDPSHAREFSPRELEAMAMRHGFRLVVRRGTSLWAEWAFWPLFAFRNVAIVHRFLRSNAVAGRNRCNYFLGRLFPGLAQSTQAIFRRER